MDVTERERHPVTDDVAAALVHKYRKTGNITEFSALPQHKQIKAVIKAHDRGASIRQLVRVTGISKGLIEKWLKKT